MAWNCLRQNRSRKAAELMEEAVRKEMEKALGKTAG